MSMAEAYSEDGELSHESANSELARLEEQAREEGFSKGYADGVAKAQAEHADKLASVTELLQTLNQSVLERDDSVKEELVDLALTIGQELLRADVSNRYASVNAVIDQAIAALPSEMSKTTVKLHPDDMFIVDELTSKFGDRVRFAEDESVGIGGCTATSDYGDVDASVAARTALIRNVLMAEQAETEGEDVER
jgi:flagellar assembly protein FliH